MPRLKESPWSVRTTVKPLASWLTYVFALQDGEWKIVHDQNTALDFPAFAKAHGM